MIVLAYNFGGSCAVSHYGMAELRLCACHITFDGDSVGKDLASMPPNFPPSL